MADLEKSLGWNELTFLAGLDQPVVLDFVLITGIRAILRLLRETIRFQIIVRLEVQFNIGQSRVDIQRVPKGPRGAGEDGEGPVPGKAVGVLGSVGDSLVKFTFK